MQIIKLYLWFKIWIAAYAWLEIAVSCVENKVIVIILVSSGINGTVVTGQQIVYQIYCIVL